MTDLQTILNSMTLEDKIALCSGANFWETKVYGKYGIPSLFMCDGPHGLRKQENASDMLGVNASRPATCFPAEVTTASSWDADLLERIGAAIGEEAKDQGVGLVLGPGANLKRNPLCGRSFEYFSEDPLLAGRLAAGFIREYEDGFEHRAAIRGANFSGGQKQRLLIARALAGDPEILILDDSSSALDYRTDAELRKAISSKYADTTLIVIAQRISSIMNLDEIIVLDEGGMIGKGTHEELMRDCPVYREIQQTQMGEVE